MKKISTLLFASFFAVLSYSQTNIPQLVSFSAILRDANNQPLLNTPVSIRLTFKEGGQTGPLIYCALHQTTTNQNGFMSLQLNRDVLGTGCNGAPNTAFQNIPWENGGFWMEVEYQTVPGSPFVNLGQLELASSFYAFAAGTAERVAGFDLSGANDGDVLTYNITTQQWEAMPPSGGGTGFSGDYNDLTNTPTVPTNVSAFTNDAGYVNTLNDDDPTNELQQLSVSATGDTLYLQNGGFVIIPGISAANNQGGGGNGIFTPGNGVTFNGYNYTSIVLGNGQEWMAENLRTTTYANGDPIPNVTDSTQWLNLTTGAWAHFNNDNQYENPYGKLYNWYTVADPRNVCPTGWHVPTDAEYTLLTDYLGGEPVSGGKMKSTGTQYWLNPNTDATNESGFSGLPGGDRKFNGTFEYIGAGGFWWSSAEYVPLGAWLRDLNYDNGALERYYYNKSSGFSVRCLRD
jgi:uncharacterized protein (TIGR02145 family)